MTKTKIATAAVAAGTGLALFAAPLAASADDSPPVESADMAVTSLDVSLPDGTTYDGPGSQRVITYKIENLGDGPATADQLYIDGGVMGVGPEEPDGSRVMRFWDDTPSNDNYEILSSTYEVGGVEEPFTGDFAPHSSWTVSYLAPLDIDYGYTDDKGTFVTVEDSTLWAPIHVGLVEADLAISLDVDRTEAKPGDHVTALLSISNHGEANPAGTTAVIPAVTRVFTLSGFASSGWEIANITLPDGWIDQSVGTDISLATTDLLQPGETVDGFKIELIAGNQPGKIAARVNGIGVLSNRWSVNDPDESNNEAYAFVNVPYEEPAIDEPSETLPDEPMVEEPEPSEPVIEEPVEEPEPSEPVIEAPVEEPETETPAEPEPSEPVIEAPETETPAQPEPDEPAIEEPEPEAPVEEPETETPADPVTEEPETVEHEPEVPTEEPEVHTVAPVQPTTPKKIATGEEGPGVVAPAAAGVGLVGVIGLAVGALRRRRRGDRS